ncbi:MAG: [FeFe] hydrogenase, group A [Clostridiales bacterium]|nr:[FeFe] hydrogenase, group A [Clostridiales bacterium]
MADVNLKINGLPVTVPQGTTILEAANTAGIKIPTLCFLKGINEIGACRVCVVEVKGARSLVASCVYPVNEGMEVFTNTEKVRSSRKTTLELLLSTHDRSCLSCSRSQNCELQALSLEYGIENAGAFDGYKPKFEKDENEYLVRDNNKCILCRRCVAVCKNNQGAGVIGANERGIETNIGCAFDMNLSKVSCIACGQCVAVCPTGALTEKDDTQKVWDALADETKHVVIAPAPSVRVQLGEEFGNPIGTNVEGKMVAAMRRLGFDAVVDVDVAADFTIIEEGTEFINRIKNNGPLPLITSCSPGWVKYCEHYYPEFIPNLSSCKSPQGMYGALMKSYYAEKKGIDPKDIFVASVMPCTAKKFERTREGYSVDGLCDIDAALTTRELAKMIKRAGINFNALPDEEFDPIFGGATGAGHIFGASGGVMEAALRTVVEKLENKELPSLDFKEVRGMEGIKEASYNVAGMEVKLAVVSGTANAAKLLDKIKRGEASYHFIEVMACPGGCVNGGGQPIHDAYTRANVDIKGLRAAALYTEDEKSKIRKSHESPVVKKVYAEYLGEAGGHKAHHLLHTTYVPRKRN